MKKKKQKHNYTSELELKSLLIRIKNKRNEKGDPKRNARINKYIRLHTDINNKKYQYPSKRNKLKAKLKSQIITLSEITSIDTPSYERFGQIILLMIKNILKKPQFSGYTYRDDFYSDAVFKILKYLHNFDHTMVSERTGLTVNAFAYISQIIHNSILFIINTKKKENNNLKKQVAFEKLNHNLQIKTDDISNKSTYNSDEDSVVFVEIIELKKVKTNLVDEINNLKEDIQKATRIDIFYPKDYRISFEEYDLLKPLLKGKINIRRSK